MDPRANARTRLVVGLLRIGEEASDTPEVTLQKRSLVLAAVIQASLAFAWVFSYWAMGLVVPAVIPLAYQMITFTNLAVFSRSKRYRFFRNCELTLSLVFPLLLHLSLGGFVASSGVVLWSFTSPVGAMMYMGRRAAIPWFFAFLAAVVLAVVLDPFLVSMIDRIPAWVLISFFGMNIAGVTGCCYFLLQYFVRERDVATRQLAEERERSEGLLRNVLPASIAERLKKGENVIADGSLDIGVLFADIAGFTPLSAGMEPQATVELLNRLFTEFDALAEKHRVEKIKTIGDAYMVASGLLGNKEDHAARLAGMALDMLAVVRDHPPLALRIGIDIGPVVAGVIGKRKFIYDLWGDTVNTASRMETHGVTGGIHVTERVFERLKGNFTFAPRGELEIKGKGVMNTYLMTGLKERPI